jgi:prephenate dehydrogenase
MNIGIIGYGSFGRLLAEVLSKNIPVSVYDKHGDIEEKTNIKRTSFEEIVKCDVIVLAVNLDALEDICIELSGNVSKNTIVVEVCSAKTRSTAILKKHLFGKCQYLATHPLFGPQSVANSKPKKIVICESNVVNKDKIYEFLKQILNLQIIEMSVEEHDKQMAWVHSLTFFVGRGLKELNLSEFELKTDYYQKLLDLVELEDHHSIELFNTVQKGNPYSQEVREQFIKKLQDINTGLNGEKK